ncbi:MAG: beta-Ala-His dipeptidase [Tissierellia bacterium]|nr:beta-Ala-His dipeptidase [Tissierellia bacterium]
MISGLREDHSPMIHYFAKLTEIPRCSGHEEAVGDFLLAWAKDQGLEAKRDKALNVVIKKPASPGYEDRPPLILQGHLDMVCEAHDLEAFNFCQDPIHAQVEGDLVIARETTLGADNGLAVAMILALLEDPDLAHPPLEALFTSDEEKGMTGAIQLDPSLVKGRRLINIDSEEEGICYVGCAGGQTDEVSFKKDLEASKKAQAYRIKLGGLLGGHSGMEIYKQRANAIKVLGRILHHLKGEEDFDLADLEGGNLSNAIPREASALILSDLDKEALEALLDPIFQPIKEEYKEIDPQMSLALDPVEGGPVVSKKTRDQLIAYLYLAPHGIFFVDTDQAQQVEASTNLGVVKSLEDSWLITSQVRASLKSRIQEIAEKNKVLAEVLEGTYQSNSFYPPWEFKKDSPLRDKAQAVWKENRGQDLQLATVHAGVECAIFIESLGEMDMISIGPDIFGVHAPGEHFSISSADRVYDFMVKYLKEL